jgi:ABC-type phosphate transport system substrate-binding protein
MRRLTSLVFFAAGIVSAADFKVVANPSVKAAQISTDELKRIFLATDTSLEGGHVVPVFEKGGATHEAFLKQYLGKTDAALSIYYRSLVFTGKAFMPKMLGSDAEVLEYVAKTRGAIGYVNAAASTPGTKEIAVR